MAPHEAARSHARIGLFGCVFACLLGALAPAHATHVLVEPGNPAAYQRINDATPLLWGVPWVDTILVAPGVYPETLIVHDNLASRARIIGIGGQGVTTVLGAAFGSTFGFAVEGVTFRDPIVDAMYGTHVVKPPGFKNCVFEQGVRFMKADCSAPNITDCVFRGDTWLQEYTFAGIASFARLRFERCTLHISSLCGYLSVSDCAFAGPVDTAVVAYGNADNVIMFTRCDFDSVAIGLAASDSLAWPGLQVESNHFRDCGTAISLRGVETFMPGGDPRITVLNSTFERMSRGIETKSNWRVLVRGSTFSDCSDAALDLMSFRTTLKDLAITNARQGVLLHGTGFRDYQNTSYPFDYALLDRLELRNIAGDGIRISADASLTSGRVTVRNSTVLHAGGEGLRLTARGVTVANNLVADNRGPGITLRQLAPAAPDSIVGNTSVLNPGGGIVVVVDSGTVASTALVEHNLAVFDGRAGITVGRFATALVQHNDAWRNSLTDLENVANPLATNLSLDPMFCAAATGDFTLQDSSPCAPAGLYGLIGALAVGCATAPLGVDSRSASLALLVGPNPSAGGVRFTLPASGRAGELEVLDLAGRRVWSTRVAAHAEFATWSGAVRGARATGVYFTRLRRGSEVVTQRFVLLR